MPGIVPVSPAQAEVQCPCLERCSYREIAQRAVHRASRWVPACAGSTGSILPGVSCVTPMRFRGNDEYSVSGATVQVP